MLRQLQELLYARNTTAVTIQQPSRIAHGAGQRRTLPPCRAYCAFPSMVGVNLIPQSSTHRLSDCEHFVELEVVTIQHFAFIGDIATAVPIPVGAADMYSSAFFHPFQSVAAGARCRCS